MIKKAINQKFITLRQIFGERVRQERIKLGLSQSKFALEIDLYRAYVGNIERGIQNVTLDTIEQVANFFDIEPGDFLDKKKLGNPEDFKMKAGRRPY